MSDLFLPLIIAASFIPGIIMLTLKIKSSALRNTINISAAMIKIGLVLYALTAVSKGAYFETNLQVYDTIVLSLSSNPLSMLFLALSSGLWLLTTIYAIGYFHQKSNLNRFFGFFNLCVASTAGIALAANLFTFLLFYELLTLTTYPLIVHKGDEESRKSGRTYLIYTLFGGTVLLLAMVWLRSLIGPVYFIEGGGLNGQAYTPIFTLIFCLFMIGFGVKAAIVPLHGWLPRAMSAPAPVSSLLHAVAVVKAGAFGIVRTIYEIYGIKIAAIQGLLFPLAIISSITIIYGSMRALFQDDLKKRLAYSTVSQVSYIVLGTAMFGPIATLGAIVHIVHQGIMKITLFFCAGIFAELLGKKKISDLNGVGKILPFSSAAFSIAAIGMIGMPPLAGFVSKWYIAIGSIEAGHPWAIGVLIISSILNAAYFFPIIYRLWFESPPEDIKLRRSKFNWALIAPAIITALLTIGFGLFAATDISPLSWTKLIIEREY